MTSYEAGIKACIHKYCAEPDVVINANVEVFRDEMSPNACVECGAELESPAPSTADPTTPMQRDTCVGITV